MMHPNDFEVVIAITSEIRAIADAHPTTEQANRLYALLAQVQAAYTSQTGSERLKIKPTRKTVWLLEAPAIPGCYLRDTVRKYGEHGKHIEHMTTEASEARQFPHRRTAEEYIRQNPFPAWKTKEYVL